MATFPGLGGALELWRDSRISKDTMSAVRRGSQPANDSLIVLRSEASSVTAELRLDTPLASLDDSIFLVPDVRTYLVSVEHIACTGRLDTETAQLLNVDVAHRHLAFQQFDGPGVLTVTNPAGGLSGIPIPSGNMQ